MPQYSHQKTQKAIREDIRAACEILQKGDLIVMPTETVYGLAGDATDAQTVQEIFKIKNRPPHNPLIIHVGDKAAVAEFAEVTPLADKLLAAFAPGPITVILRQSPDNIIAPQATAGLPTVAVRIPAHEFAQDLLQALPFPLAAPSANRSGYVSPTQAAHCADLGVPIFDGGTCHYGLESTVIDATTEEPYLLRQGAITGADIEAELGVTMKPLASGGDNSAPSLITSPIISPGQLLKHYSPRLPLATDVAETQAKAGDAYIAFGDCSRDCFRNLSPTGDLRQAARNLYAYLREADVSGKRRIAVAPIPAHGLGLTIRERLAKAGSNSEQKNQ